MYTILNLSWKSDRKITSEFSVISMQSYKLYILFRVNLIIFLTCLLYFRFVIPHEEIRYVVTFSDSNG